MNPRQAGMGMGDDDGRHDHHDDDADLSRSARISGGEQAEFRVTIHETDLESIAGWVLRHPDRETGGNLFGLWTHTGAPTIQLVIGPGPHARHHAAAFFQDPAYMSAAGASVHARYGLQHIGDWHSHHTLGLDQPSAGDAETVLRTLRTNDFPRFLTCIATIRGHSAGRRHGSGGADSQAVRLEAYLFEPGVHRPRRGQWMVLPGASPIGESARQSRLIGQPPHPRPWEVRRAPAGGASPVRAVHPDQWYAQDWGQQFLRRLGEVCAEVCDQHRMTVKGRDLVVHLVSGSERWSVTFPRKFPDGKVRVVGSTDEPKKIQLSKPLDPEELLAQLPGWRGLASVPDGAGDVAATDERYAASDTGVVDGLGDSAAHDARYDPGAAGGGLR